MNNSRLEVQDKSKDYISPRDNKEVVKDSKINKTETGTETIQGIQGLPTNTNPEYQIFPDLRNPKHKNIMLTGLNNIVNSTQPEFNTKMYKSSTNITLLEKQKVNQNFRSRKMLEPINNLKFTSSKEIILNSIYPRKKKDMNRSISIPVLKSSSIKNLTELAIAFEKENKERETNLNNSNFDKKSIISDTHINNINVIDNVQNIYNLESENGDKDKEEGEIDDLKNSSRIKEIETEVTLIIDEELLVKHFVLIGNWMDLDQVSTALCCEIYVLALL